MGIEANQQFRKLAFHRTKGGVLMPNEGIFSPDRISAYRETFPNIGGTNLTWTTDLGSPNYNYTTEILEGDASFYLPLSPISTASLDGTIGSWDSVYISLMFKQKAAETVLTHYDIVWVTDFDWNNVIALMQLWVSGSDAQLKVNASLNVTAGHFTLSNNTLYYIKMYFKKGTGANAEAHLWHSTDGKTWTDDGGITNGTWTVQVQSLWFQTLTNQTGWGIWDDIRISDQDINY